MFAEERQQQILSRLAQQGRVEVADLAALMHVSEDTVRRDLKTLQARGYLQKTHGGAVALDTGRMAWSTRADLNARAKSAIGAAAARLVEAHQSVILDADSTIFELSRRLRVRPLSVLTNSLDIAAIFAAEPEVQLGLTGGDWHPDSRYLVGSDAVHALAQRRADWAFVGACAVHPGTGVTSVSQADAAVKRAMMASAERVVVLADASKLGQIAPYLVSPLAQLYALVTDDREFAASLEAAGVRVLLAAPSP